MMHHKQAPHCMSAIATYFVSDPYTHSHHDVIFINLLILVEPCHVNEQLGIFCEDCRSAPMSEKTNILDNHGVQYDAWMQHGTTTNKTTKHEWFLHPCNGKVSTKTQEFRGARNMATTLFFTSFKPHALMMKIDAHPTIASLIPFMWCMNLTWDAFVESLV